MRRCVLLLTVISLLMATASAAAQPQQQSAQSVQKNQPLTNKDVVQMLHDGLSPEIVMAKIKSATCSFDTSPPALKDLKTESVPDGVILAMVQAASGAGIPGPSTAPVSSAAQTEVAPKDGKPRVYVSDSQSWLVSGGFGMANGTGGGAVRGGSSPQTVEIIKTLQQRCPEIVVTDVREKANYAILFDRESFKGYLRNRDKIAVFRRDGDSIFSDSTRSVGNAVKDACAAILKDAGGNPK
jgi:hypothetical protein